MGVFVDDQYNIRPLRVVAGIVVGLLCIPVIVFLAGMSWHSVPPDFVMLHYSGGPIEGKKFQEVVAPGTGVHYYGQLESIYYLPATQRNYIIDRDPKTGDKGGTDFVRGVSNDRVPFTFEVAVYFKLNTQPQTIRKFFEQVCLHDNCYDMRLGEGWDKMLAQYFRPPLEQAVRLESGRFDREHIYSDPETLLALNNAIASDLRDRVNEKLGGPYFCGPNSGANECEPFQVILKNPMPPDNVVKAYADTAAATQRVKVAQQEAEARVRQAEGEAEAQRQRRAAPALTSEQLDYIRAQAMATCAANRNCTLVLTDGGTGVNVNVR